MHDIFLSSPVLKDFFHQQYDPTFCGTNTWNDFRSHQKHHVDFRPIWSCDIFPMRSLKRSFEILIRPFFPLCNYFLRDLWRLSSCFDPSTCQFLFFFLPETLRIPLARIGLYILGFVCVFGVILFFTNCTMGFITIVHLGVIIFWGLVGSIMAFRKSKCIWILWGEALPTTRRTLGPTWLQAPRSVSPSYAAQHAKRQGGRFWWDFSVFTEKSRGKGGVGPG